MSKALSLEVLRPSAVIVPKHEDTAYLDALADGKRKHLQESTRQTLFLIATERYNTLAQGKFLLDIAEILKPMNAFQRHCKRYFPHVTIKTLQRRMKDFKFCEERYGGPVTNQLLRLGFDPVSDELVEARRYLGPPSGDAEKYAKDIVDWSQQRRKRVNKQHAEARKDHKEGKAPKPKKVEIETTSDPADHRQFAIDIYRVIVSRCRQVSPQKRRNIIDEAVGQALNKLGLHSSITIQPQAVKEGSDPEVGRPKLVKQKAAGS